MPQMPPFTTTDVLRPIGTDNREETILVEFHRMLKNTNVSLIYNLFEKAKDDADLRALFPNIPKYGTMSIDELYHATIMHNRHVDMVYNLSDERLSYEMCGKYVDAFLHPLQLDMLHITRMELVLRHLCDAEFVKKVYIVADSFTIEMQRYLVDVFGAELIGSKVEAAECNLSEAMLQAPEITTAFISNATDLLDMAEVYPETIQGKYFILGEGYGNVELDPKNPKQTLNVGQSTFLKWHNSKICDVGHMYLYPIYRE